MKKLMVMLGLVASVGLLTSCTKTDLPAQEIDVDRWMQIHERGRVAYVDYFTGAYIVETVRGYSVVEGWGGFTPREWDTVYASFSLRGMQRIYNHSGRYFTQGRVVDSWLSWGQALFLLDQMRFR